MLKKILTVLAGVGAFFSAIFFVLFKQAKEEKRQSMKSMTICQTILMHLQKLTKLKRS